MTAMRPTLGQVLLFMPCARTCRTHLAWLFVAIMGSSFFAGYLAAERSASAGARRCIGARGEARLRAPLDAGVRLRCRVDAPVSWWALGRQTMWESAQTASRSEYRLQPALAPRRSPFRLKAGLQTLSRSR